MDKLQHYLIQHPQLARSYAIIWQTILKAYPQVAKMQSPRQWDEFLHANEHHLNKHLSTQAELRHGELKRAGEMLWYYGPAALSSPVQAAIHQLDGHYSGSSNSEEVSKNTKETKSKDATNEIHYPGTYSPAEDIQDDTRSDKGPPPGAVGTYDNLTAADTVPIVAAAAAQSPQAQAAQKIQQAADEGSAQSVAAKIDTAKAEAPLSPTEKMQQVLQNSSPHSSDPHAATVEQTRTETGFFQQDPIAQRVDTLKPIPPSETELITPSGQKLSSSPLPNATYDEEGNEIDTDNEEEQQKTESSHHHIDRRQLERLEKNMRGTQSFTRRTPSGGTMPQTQTSSGGGANSDGGSSDGIPPRSPRRSNRRGTPMGGLRNIAKGGTRLASLGSRATSAAAPIIAFFSSPPGWITALVIAILILILIIYFIVSGGFGLLNDGEVTVTVTKTGPAQVPNPESQDVTIEDPSDINYQIKVSWTGGPSSITVTDKLPANTEFVSATGPHTYNEATRTVTWNISGGGGGGGGVAGDIASLLPNPVPPDPSGVEDKKSEIVSHFQNNPELIQHYKDASAKTGLPWQVYAGLHWREGDATPGYSLTSGRPIGGYEPDPDAGGDCTGPVGAVDGKPDTNCTFADAVDDIMYASDHLVGKISKMPSTHEELSEALARYNGFPGRANCTPKSPLYDHCPELFPGEDNSYVFTFFDEKHAVMDEVFCGDGQRCGPLKATRPGAMTVIKWVAQGIQ